jgi:hypothetical protein
MGYYDYGWMPYVTVAERRHRAEKQMRKFLKKGQTASPIALQGRTIARTFWGRPGATTSSGTATMRTACRADAPMCETVRCSICRLFPAESSQR